MKKRNNYLHRKNLRAKEALEEDGFKFEPSVREHWVCCPECDEHPAWTTPTWECVNADMSGRKWHQMLVQRGLLYRGE